MPSDRDPSRRARETRSFGTTLARGTARRKIPQLELALEGAEFFTREHAALLKAMLARIDAIDADIARLAQVIEELLAPYEEQL